MDWNLAIEKNTHALAQIVADLWKLVGIRPKFVEMREAPISSSDASTTPSFLCLSQEYMPEDLEHILHHPKNRKAAGMDPRHEGEDDGMCKSRDDESIYIGPIARRILVRTLRTIEAALRRLILLYVYVYVHGVKATTRKRQEKRDRPLPDFASFGSGAGDRPPVFKLFDPRKPLSFVLREAQGEGFGCEANNTPRHPGCHANRDPFEVTLAHLAAMAGHSGSRIAVASGMTSESEAESMPEDVEHILHHRGIGEASGMDPRVKPEDDGLRWIEDDGVGVDLLPDSKSIIRRLAALDYALNTLPQQAKRLARIMAKREQAPPGVGRIGPIRPGIPPGSNKQSKEPSHEVLRELHGLVRDWEKDAWERRCERNAEP